MKTENPGVAKFGIALEWGSRGRWFESSHSDQNGVIPERISPFLYVEVVGIGGIFWALIPG